MLRTISVVLSANATSFAAQMRTASMAVGQFGDEFHSMATRTDASSRRVLDTVGKLSLGVGAGLAVAFGASVMAAASFDREMRNVASISDSVKGNFDRASQSLIDMSRVLPQSATTLAKGMYDIASSGFQGAEGMSVLKASAIAASAGLTTTDVAAKGVTAVLNAYGKSGFEAAEVSDILFQTVNLGVVSFEELAGNLGDFVGTAAQLGVPIEDAAAALATMTLSGISAAEASTSLNRVMLAFIDPSKEMTATLKAQGYESGVAAVQALGLKGALELTGRATGGNIEQMQKLFPEVRGLKGALASLANEGENYSRVAAGITDETARMGATQKAYNTQSEGFSFQLELAKNNLSAMGIEIGRLVLPRLNDLLGMITSVTTGFSAMPEPLKAATVGLGAIVGMVGAVGGAFVLLKPKIDQVSEMWTKLATNSPALAAGLRGVGAAAGVLGVALIGLNLYYSVIAASQREFKATVEDLTEALLAEKRGMEGATDAAIYAQLIQRGMVGEAAALGISYETLTKAVKGNEGALASMGIEAGRAVGTINSAGSALGGMGLATMKAGQENNQFGASVIDVRNALAVAAEKVRLQEERTTLLMQATGKTKKELIDLNLVTETTGDKIAAIGATIGLSAEQMKVLGIESEEAAKKLAESVTKAMDATRSAFMKDFDLVATFSASSWERMQSDATKGTDRILEAEEKLAKAHENLGDVQERVGAKTKASVADQQALEKAERQVTEAAEALREAHAGVGDSLGPMGVEIEKFYRTSLVEARSFSENIGRAIQMGYDPAVISRLLQEGPKQAAPLLQAMVSDHSGTLRTLINESESALSQVSAQAVEMSRLTSLAVSSHSDQMGKDLKLAMQIAQAEAASGGKLTADALAMSLNVGLDDIKRVVGEFGITIPAAFSIAGQQSSDYWSSGIGPLAPNTEALLRATDEHWKNYIGPIPPWVLAQAQMMAANFKLGIDPMPGDATAVVTLVDSKVRGVLAALPGFTDDTARMVTQVFRIGLDPMPGDTQARAESTANALRAALDPLPGHAESTSYNMVAAWLRELAKGEGGTSAQTAAWARALLNILNPLLTGVGSAPISMEQQGPGDMGWVGNAEGGMYEQHTAQIAPGGAWRVWAEPETEGEAYIPFARSKRGRSVDILKKVAEKFNMAVVEYAEGGITSADDLPRPSGYGPYGHMVGHTGKEDALFTYAEVKAWVAAELARQEEERKKAAEMAAKGGGQPYSGGSIGSGWQQITGYLDSVGQAYTITSTYRPGDPGFHGRGKAVDMVGDMAAIFNTLAAGNPVPGINELFHDPMGYSYDEGVRVGWVPGGHGGHVHAATFDLGGILWPGYTLAFNGTGRPELVSRFANGGYTKNVSNTGQMSTSTQSTGATGAVTNKTTITTSNGTSGASLSSPPSTPPTSGPFSYGGPGYADGQATTWTGSALTEAISGGRPFSPQTDGGGATNFPFGGGNLAGFAERTAYRVVTGSDVVYDDNLNGRPDAWEGQNQAPPGLSMGVGGGGSVSVDNSINPTAHIRVEVHIQPGASKSVIEATVQRAVNQANQAFIDRVRTQIRSRIRV